MAKLLIGHASHFIRPELPVNAHTLRLQVQARFGARGDGISLQMWLVQPLENRGGDRDRIGMLRSSEDLLDLFSRSYIAACGVG